MNRLHLRPSSHSAPSMKCCWMLRCGTLQCGCVWKFLPKPLAHKVCLAPVVPFITEPLGENDTFVSRKEETGFTSVWKWFDLLWIMGILQCLKRRGISAFRFCFTGSFMAILPAPCRMVIPSRPLGNGYWDGSIRGQVLMWNLLFF